MLSQEPKNGDFVRYIDALQAGKLAEIKAENRHLEMNDLSDEGWAKKVGGYLEKSAKRVEPSIATTSVRRPMEKRHLFMLLGFACMALGFILFVLMAALEMQEGLVFAVWFFFGGVFFLKMAEKEGKRGVRKGASQKGERQ